jgi:hypothetical protein
MVEFKRIYPERAGWSQAVLARIAQPNKLPVRARANRQEFAQRFATVQVIRQPYSHLYTRPLPAYWRGLLAPCPVSALTLVLR